MSSVAINSFGVCQIKPGRSNLLNVNVRKKKLIQPSNKTEAEQKDTK